MKTPLLPGLFVVVLGAMAPAILHEVKPGERLAEIKARQYAAVFSFNRPIEVRIESDYHGQIARTTRAYGGDGCTIHLTQPVIDRDDILAHETCHCVLDYDLLWEYGYVIGVTEPVWRSMEERARRCEKWLGEGHPGEFR